MVDVVRHRTVYKRQSMITLDLPEPLEKHFWDIVRANYHGDLQAAMVAFLELHEKYGWKEQFVRDVESIREEVHRKGSIGDSDIKGSVKRYRNTLEKLEA